MYRIAKISISRSRYSLLVKKKGRKGWYRLGTEQNKKLEDLLFFCGIKLHPVPYYLDTTALYSALTKWCIESPENLNNQLDKICID